MKKSFKEMLKEVKMLNECGVHCGVWREGGGFRLVAAGKKGRLNFTPVLDFDTAWKCVQLLWK
jgi:hypothetical protein